MTELNTKGMFVVKALYCFDETDEMARTLGYFPFYVHAMAFLKELAIMNTEKGDILTNTDDNERYVILSEEHGILQYFLSREI